MWSHGHANLFVPFSRSNCMALSTPGMSWLPSHKTPVFSIRDTGNVFDTSWPDHRSQTKSCRSDRGIHLDLPWCLIFASSRIWAKSRLTFLEFLPSEPKKINYRLSLLLKPSSFWFSETGVFIHPARCGCYSKRLAELFYYFCVRVS